MGAKIAFLYEGRLADGDVFDTCNGKPHTIEAGRGQIMPKLEKALLEMQEGEEQEVRLAPDDAYGRYDPNGVQRISWADIPDAEHLPVGEYIAWKNPVSQKPIPAKVLSSENGWAELDLNHPLADCELVYRVKLLSRSE